MPLAHCITTAVINQESFLPITVGAVNCVWPPSRVPKHRPIIASFAPWWPVKREHFCRLRRRKRSKRTGNKSRTPRGIR